ncbi:MAG: DUF4268 domain-containing protein [Bacteroidetes bacterium]|nr:DUF4268 domain-containing protein [Bacteroidota bacterium]MBL0016694.1 DUF4268 domain-containing protein [Bacteroidota bacterium]MBP6722196.1 DUF4268 domain-containing protein [Bacteroidia bacterium]
MFSKEEAKQLRIDFWTAFGVYMRQHLPVADANKKWVNYNTGVKGIFFRLDAEPKFVRVSITVEHSDEGIRGLFYEQWLELRSYLEIESNAEWTWVREEFLPDGRPISRISRMQQGLSLYNRADWSSMFQFLESGILPLDSIWADCGDVFKDLAE